MLPLANGKGRMEFFNEPLYLYNQNAIELFGFPDFQKCVDYYSDYRYLNKWAINRLEVSDAKREELLLFAEFAYFGELFSFIGSVTDGKEHEIEVVSDFIQLLNDTIKPKSDFTIDLVLSIGCLEIYKRVVDVLLKTEKSSPPINIKSKIIGYGALGQQAAKILPLLKGSCIEPTELWDKNCSENIDILKPQFPRLTKDDVLLIFPKAQHIVNEIENELSGINASVLKHNDILNILIADKFTGSWKTEV
jgi:hypothetical protein